MLIQEMTLKYRNRLNFGNTMIKLELFDNFQIFITKILTDICFTNFVTNISYSTR